MEYPRWVDYHLRPRSRAKTACVPLTEPGTIASALKALFKHEPSRIHSHCGDIDGNTGHLAASDCGNCRVSVGSALRCLRDALDCVSRLAVRDALGEGCGCRLPERRAGRGMGALVRRRFRARKC